MTIWGNSYNTDYNHWGGRGMTVDILDASFVPVDLDLKYKFSNWNSVYNLCFWVVGP